MKTRENSRRFLTCIGIAGYLKPELNYLAWLVVKMIGQCALWLARVFGGLIGLELALKAAQAIWGKA